MKIEYLELKDNLYQELVRLKKNEDLERNTMGREIQEVLDKQKQERKEFVCNQNLRLFYFKANQKTERDEKERSFEEEQESKIISSNWVSCLLPVDRLFSVHPPCSG